LRVVLHPDLKGAAPSVPQAWVDGVSQHELVPHLLRGTVFLVSLRKGTRRLLTLPVEWALLWAAPADPPLHVWMLEYDDLSLDEERQIVRAALLRHTGGMSKRATVELAARCRFFGMSKHTFATLLSMSEATVQYYVPWSRAADADRVPVASNPWPPGTPRGTEGHPHAQPGESRPEEPTQAAAVGPPPDRASETVQRGRASVGEARELGLPARAAAQGPSRRERMGPLLPNPHEDGESGSSATTLRAAGLSALNASVTQTLTLTRTGRVASA
jgi:hypothetical protein